MAVQLPTTQKGVWIENPGPDATFRIRNDLPIPSPGPNQVLVKVEASGICGSEIRAIRGYGVYNPIPGHEGIGTVVQLGSDVPPALFGSRVGVKWLWSACGDKTKCSPCRLGHPNNCPAQLNSGKSVPGTLQEYVVADARYLTQIPPGLDSVLAAPLLCAGLTMVGAVSKLASYEPNDWVVILGSGGGLGHLGVQLAKNQNLRVVAVDTGDRKRDLSIKCGADVFVDFATEDVAARVKELTGEGARGVIVVAAAPEAFEVAAQTVRNMGDIITVGLPRNDYCIPLSASLCSARALTVTGVATGTEEQMEQLLQQSLAGEVTATVETIELGQVPEVFEKLFKGDVVARFVARIA